MINELIRIISTYLFGPGLCIALFLCGTYLIFRLGTFPLTHPQKTYSALKSGNGGGISPMRAMIVALAGTLGVGNISGVASAIAIGGPGAVFWMLVSTVAAMPIKYAEIVLAVCHRRLDTDKNPHGGAYFYIADRGSRIAKIIAIIFALMCLFTSLAMGCAVQSNAIAVSLSDALGVSPVVCGIAVAALTLTVVSGGLVRISLLTEKMIPFMSAVYILMSLYVIGTNLPILPDVAREIIRGAFDSDAISGGIIGFLTSRALRVGVTRGIVSNEAGCGTAPIAHASAKVKAPAAQGVWGMCEVAIDTVVICTLTALVVLIGERQGVTLGTDGMKTAIEAFGKFIPFSEYILAVSVAVFAFCTIVCWFYYGTESLSYLTKRRSAHLFYLILYAIFAFIGAITSGESVWSLSDLTVSSMCAVNTVTLMLYSHEIKHETDKYFHGRDTP